MSAGEPDRCERCERLSQALLEMYREILRLQGVVLRVRLENVRLYRANRRLEAAAIAKVGPDLARFLNTQRRESREAEPAASALEDWLKRRPRKLRPR